MHRRTDLSFVDEFRRVSLLHYLKNRRQNAVLLWSCCKQGRRHLYTTTAPSCCIPASYCHLSATLQTISIIVVTLKDTRAVFRIFITLLRSSFVSLSYLRKRTNVVVNDTRNVNFGNSSPLRCYPCFGRTRTSIFKVKQWITWRWRRQLFNQRQSVMCQKTWLRFIYVLYIHEHFTISFLQGEAPCSLQHLLFFSLTLMLPVSQIVTPGVVYS